MKKSNTTPKKRFRTIGDRICLPMIMLQHKTKFVVLKDEEGNIIDEREVVVSGKEKIVDLWLNKTDIGAVQSYINSRNQISPVRCWVESNVSNVKYLIAASPEDVLNNEKRNFAGYGTTV